MIAIEWGRKTAASLTVRDIDVQFKEYPGVTHDIADDMVTGVSKQCDMLN